MNKRFFLMFFLMSLLCGTLASAFGETITLDYVYDGSGTKTLTLNASDGFYINCWNTASVTVNGTDCTNTYKSFTTCGTYEIVYNASVPYAHIEIKKSGTCTGGDPTNPPATNPPATDPPATNPPATNPPATDPPSDPTPEPPDETPPPGDDWLSRDGNCIKDANGKVVRLTGANWFGFNNNQYVFDGLYSCNMRDSLQAMADRGFNILRVPMSGNVTKTWTAGSPINPAQDPSNKNPDLAGLNSLQVFDKAIGYCKEMGMKIMVDFHSAAMDDHAHPLWYKDSYTTANWFADWEFVANRYKNDDTILIMDLENEPHGKPWQEEALAKWDNSSDTNNWKKAFEDCAAKIFAKNPNVLVMVEGIEGYPKDGVTWTVKDEDIYYANWWGGNLRGFADYPINLGSKQNKLVISPHDYGPLVYEQPWFYSGFSQSTLMADCWEPNWYYLVGEYPILIGEWGGRMDGGRNQTWLEALADLIASSNLHHTFWCFNPNSGDTGGLVTDWVNWDEAKYNLVKPTLWRSSSGKFIGLDHVVPLGTSSTGMTVASYYSGGGSAPVPPTSPPATDPPATNPPATDPPATNPPATNPPATNPPATDPPATNPPATDPPATNPPATDPPATDPPPTDPPTGDGCTCDAGCSSITAITPSFTKDGSGEFCFEATSLGNYINSWNLTVLEVNGVDLTNKYTSASGLPAKIDGKYYVYYKSDYSYGHFEVKN